MSRTSVKQAIATAIQGVTGLKKVYTYFPRRQQGMVFPSAVIALEKTNETAATMGNPGKRHIHYTAVLYIQKLDSNPKEDVAEQAFDDLLDNIDTALRADKTLGNTVLMSAWKTIDTDFFAPLLAGQGAELTYRAVKTFDVLVEILG